MTIPFRALGRHVAVASFGLAASFVAACGHQVTPEPSLLNSNLAGKMMIRFRTVNALDFTNFTYAIIFDTCGNGVPLPNAFATSFQSYSYGFLIGGLYGNIAQPQLFEYFLNPSAPGNITYLNEQINPTTIQFEPDSNGLGTEFTITFDRALFDNPFAQRQPCPNITPIPTSTASASASPTSSATTTPRPSSSPTPVVGNPNPQPTTAAQSVWLINFFSIDSSKHVADSLGLGGATDTSWSGSPTNVNQSSDVTLFRPAGSQFGQGAAAIAGGEIANYP